ncbi:LysR family transcriptional regulator [Ruegeria sp. PrR005]|uniref:LysR family transcriptional regulator n=1 Tax=Ruegeria sp. PrR005 TaxID=2706882 RepID=A0A6B2NVI9_9RHOB|nr:LysR family transcriptional regulator [Ruegeria sp. PrR005]NDW45915.1 LysR family transcriptional regulator [Ruegeria sp. PrR005]
MAKARIGLPPLDWLRVFEAAGRLGGFAAAAREFGLTQAAVSQRIGNLETWLGRALFVRGPRGVTLTIEGESFLPLVQESLTALERNTEDLFGTAPRELRVAGLPSHVQMLVVARAGPFLTRNPDVRLVTDSVAQRASFDDERTWLQVRYGKGNWPGREARLIAGEVLAPMAAPGVDWSAGMIELRGERPGWSEWTRLGEDIKGALTRLSVDSMEHALGAAEAGLGVVLGSIPLARAALTSGRLYRLDLPEMPTRDGYWLTWPADRLGGRRMRTLVESFHAAICE